MNRKFGQAETNVTNIRALNEDEAVIRYGKLVDFL